MQVFVWPYKAAFRPVELQVTKRSAFQCQCTVSTHPKKSLNLIHFCICFSASRHLLIPNSPHVTPSYPPSSSNVNSQSFSRRPKIPSPQRLLSMCVFICPLAFPWATIKAYIPLFYIPVLCGQTCCLCLLIRYLKT